jgi:predicted negative regulator of RcsB-dependent stress response
MGEHVGEIFDLQLVRDSLSGIISGLVVIVIVSVISRKAWRWWNRKHQNRAEGQSQQDSPHSYQQSASGAGRDIHQAGRDIVLGQQTAPQVLQP